jgi:hypothetical protein
MDDTEQYPLCNEETAYHETGHAIVGVVLGRSIQWIDGIGGEGWANFASCPTLTPRDLIPCNVAGYVAEELWRFELNNPSSSEIPCLESSELISRRIKANLWAGIPDAVEAVENARKAQNAHYKISDATNSLPPAEDISLLDEINSAERRAAVILWRRWEVVQMIATVLRERGSMMVGCEIREKLGPAGMNRASDE